MMLYLPSFWRRAASSMDPAIGATMWALASQRCFYYEGCQQGCAQEENGSGVSWWEEWEVGGEFQDREAYNYANNNLLYIFVAFSEQ